MEVVSCQARKRRRCWQALWPRPRSRSPLVRCRHGTAEAAVDTGAAAAAIGTAAVVATGAVWQGDRTPFRVDTSGIVMDTLASLALASLPTTTTATVMGMVVIG